MKDNWYWCGDNTDKKNICDGTKSHCISKGEEACNQDSSCVGFMWNSGWALSLKGVKFCTKIKLVTKPERDWETYLKRCDEGNMTFIHTSHNIGYEISYIESLHSS